MNFDLIWGFFFSSLCLVQIYQFFKEYCALQAACVWVSRRFETNQGRLQEADYSQHSSLGSPGNRREPEP